MQRVRIATRESALALWQARRVAGLLERYHPGLSVELKPMSTRGDRLLDRPLAEIGGKGLFLKELEQALAAGDADLAVHSMKDIPNQLPPGFAVPVVLERDDPRDALVSPRCARLDELPRGARVGTSSLRRRAQLLHRRPDLDLVSLRGNVNTRLDKLDRGDFDAIILAAAGLDRLGLEARIRERIAPSACLPAVAQGAIAVEVRAGDRACEDLLRPLHDPPTARRVAAERAFSARLGGSCQVPLAAHAELDGARLRLRGLVATPDGERLLADSIEGAASDGARLGQDLARRLLERGAGEILAVLSHASRS